MTNSFDLRRLRNGRAYLMAQARPLLRIIFSLPGIHDITLKASARKLQRYMDAEQGLDDVLDTVRQFRGYGLYRRITLLQSHDEIKPLVEVVKESRPKVAVEIGTAFGGSFYLWGRVFPTLEILLSVDLPGSFRGRYPYKRKPLLENIDTQAKLRFVLGDSKTEKVKNAVMTALGSREIDFLFIDGDHSYEGVKADFRNYAPLVRPRGIIGFDDIYPHPNRGVHRLWAEIREVYEAHEFQSDDSEGDGVGFIRWDPDQTVPGVT